jgi:hypothetical protein
MTVLLTAYSEGFEEGFKKGKVVGEAQIAEAESRFDAWDHGVVKAWKAKFDKLEAKMKKLQDACYERSGLGVEYKRCLLCGSIAVDGKGQHDKTCALKGIDG